MTDVRIEQGLTVDSGWVGMYVCGCDVMIECNGERALLVYIQYTCTPEMYRGARCPDAARAVST